MELLDGGDLTSLLSFYPDTKLTESLITLIVSEVLILNIISQILFGLLTL
jgi:hypothetical protein